jgi:hypothetical protein
MSEIPAVVLLLLQAPARLARPEFCRYIAPFGGITVAVIISMWLRYWWVWRDLVKNESAKGGY